MLIDFSHKCVLTNFDHSWFDLKKSGTVILQSISNFSLGSVYIMHITNKKTPLFLFQDMLKQSNETTTAFS